jgi:Mn-dependent DtxR family transcriptional regulator
VAELSEAIQHYLRAIYRLGRDGGHVSVGAIARAQEVSDASVSAMVKKLDALELVDHTP